MFSSVAHILPMTSVKRTRLLPVLGKVLVRAGQNVRAEDVIATATARPKHYMLNVARGLGVSEVEVEKHIERYTEEKIEEGDVIATRSGFGKRIVRSPVTGKIELISGGQVLIEVKTKPFELKAGLPGTVRELIHNRGAVIEATGALVQGVWGNGNVGFGILNVLAKSPDQALSPDQIDVGLRGSIIMGGYCDQDEALRNAGEQRLRGIILSNIAPTLLPLARKMPYPVIVIDGFKNLPLNSAAFKLLSTNDRREIALNAEPFNRSKGTKPDILIPIPTEETLDTPPDVSALEPGQRVRITRAPYQGEVAVVETLLPGLVTFPNALRASAVSLRLDSGVLVQVPVPNLEILN